MRAAVYRKKGPAAEVLRIEERPRPDPGPGEVRVAMAFSGVNPSDVKSRAGISSRPGAYAEVIPHSDGAGVVDAVGSDDVASLLGRRVWVYNAQWERPFGTAADFVVLPAAQVVALPDGVPLEVGASIGIPLMTAFHAVQACGPVLARDIIVPGAAGSVGFYAAQLARLAGARVIGVVSNEAKAQIARAAGATSVVDYRKESLVERVRELTGGQGADAIIDVDAAAHAAHYGELLGFGGKAVVYGTHTPQIGLPFGPSILGFLSLYFFMVYRLPAPVMRQTIDGVNRLLEAGSLQHPPVALFDLDQIAQAHERVERGADAKVLLRL